MLEIDKTRDNKWLEEMMYDLWENHFNDVARPNLVVIKFGKGSGRQLGCIRMANAKTRGIQSKINELNVQDHKSISVITITKFYKFAQVPEYVVRETVAHEMCHYAHGFNSPLQKIFNHPHKGGIIRKELDRRGLGEVHRMAKKWLKVNWVNLLKEIAR